ncbi:MAG: hypothetical protein AAF944_19025 [Bacteroidota bacterium]
MLLSESLLDQLAESVLAQQRIHRRQRLNTIVSIGGGSCTGKSSQVAAGLMTRLGEQTLLLAQDRYQRNPEYLKNMHPLYRGDHPNNYGISTCGKVLSQLKRGQSVTVPNYAFRPDQPIGSKIIHPRPIIIFEGLYAGHDNLREYCDLFVYVEAPYYARLLRRILRNTCERYRKEPALVLRGFLSSVTAAHQDFVVKQKSSTNLIIQTGFNISDAIQRFNLTPLPHHYELSPKFTFDIDAATTITITRRDEILMFLLLYQNQPYLIFAIDEELANQLEMSDMWAY